MPWKDPEKLREYDRKRSQEPQRKANIAKASKESHERRMKLPTSEPVRARRIARTNAWNKAHPEKVKPRAQANARKHKLRIRYGLTVAEFDFLFEQQEVLCGVCSRLMCKCPSKCSKKAVIDHDHTKTGRDAVRGLVCSSCNSGMGHLGDDPQRLRAAVVYLETSNTWTQGEAA